MTRSTNTTQPGSRTPLGHHSGQPAAPAGPVDLPVLRRRRPRITIAVAVTLVASLAGAILTPAGPAHARPNTPIIDPGVFGAEFGPPVGTPATIALKPASGDTGVVSYRYGFSPNTLTNTALAAADGTATVPLTLWTPNPTTIYARAVDATGAASTTAAATRIRAKAGNATPKHKRGDVTGDGLADASFLYANSAKLATAWTIPTTTGTPAAQPGIATDIANPQPGGYWGGYLTVKGDTAGTGRAGTTLLRQEPNGHVTAWTYEADGTQLTKPAGPAWDSGPGWEVARIKAIAGDYNGDGIEDIAILYNHGNCTSSITVLDSDGYHFHPRDTWRGNNSWCWESSTLFAGVNATPHTGGGFGIQYDYGNCTMGLWTLNNRRDGRWDFTLSWQSQPGAWCVGPTTTIGADFTGDNRGDAAIFVDYGNCTTALFTFTYQAPGSMTPTQRWRSNTAAWCGNRTKPVTGDFDGDNKADIGSLYVGDGNRIWYQTFNSKTNLNGPTHQWASQPNTLNGWNIAPL